MRTRTKTYGASVYCYELGPEGWAIVRKEHFIAPNRDMAKLLASNFATRVSRIYDKTEVILRDVVY